MTSNLVLNLQLDEVIHNDQVNDESDHDYDGKVNGAKLVFDEAFGSCLNFDGKGNYVALPNIINTDYSTGLTIEAWVYYSSFKNGSRIIDFGNGQSSDNIVFANLDGTNSLALSIYQGSSVISLKKSSVLETNQWMHLAATIDPVGNATLYINGQPISRGSVHLPNSVDRHNNYIGKSNWSEDDYFQGRIANVRVYNCALSQQQINYDLEADQPSLALFRKSHPIEFSLHDINAQPILSIGDSMDSRAVGQDLSLKISNTSGRVINLTKLEIVNPDSPVLASSGTRELTTRVIIDPPNLKKDKITEPYHFELKFRPGTLSEPDIEQITLAEAGDWSLSYQKQSDRAISFYLTSLQPRAIGPNEPISLTLKGVRTDGNQGSRGSKVELKYTSLYYQGKPIPISGSRVQHLNIVNQPLPTTQGTKTIPLHVGFVGTNTILNDGSSKNELTLKLTNTSKTTLTLQSTSKLIVSFDVQAEGETKEWALGTTNQVKAIEVAARGWQSLPQTEGESPEWILTPPPDITALDPGKFVEITVSNIISLLSSGYTNLYIRYENISDYGDGQFICVLEKTPLIHRGNNVGIGTEPGYQLDVTKPGAKLDVADRVRVRQGESGTAGVLFYQTTPKQDRAFVGMVNDHQVGFRGESETNWGFVIDTTTGNVGIGTTEPGAKLEVNGSIKSPMWRVTPIFDNDSGPLPLTKEFTTGGGTLLIFASGSVFCVSEGLVGIAIEIDDEVQGKVHIHTNEQNSHKMLSKTFSVSGIAAGTHKATIAIDSDFGFKIPVTDKFILTTLTDSYDAFNLTILELPF